jgi:hypothetical protein
VHDTLSNDSLQFNTVKHFKNSLPESGEKAQMNAKIVLFLFFVLIVILTKLMIACYEKKTTASPMRVPDVPKLVLGPCADQNGDGDRFG